MNFAHLRSLEARKLIRSGEWNRPTTGLALGYVQANLVILPQSWAEEFAIFCHLNPRPAPILEITCAGNSRPMKVAAQADLRTDILRYCVYHKGELVEEPEDIQSFW